jgi:[acyl-carrier-protein] S-malonyltransferase
MRPAGEKLKGYLEKVSVGAIRMPLINNVDVKTESDPARIKDALVRQAASPVRWIETIKAMAAQGVTHVVECGPGKVLAGMVKRIDPALTGIAAADRATLEQALATINAALKGG